jgi:hypothetical protein
MKMCPNRACPQDRHWPTVDRIMTCMSIKLRKRAGDCVPVKKTCDVMTSQTLQNVNIVTGKWRSALCWRKLHMFHTVRRNEVLCTSSSWKRDFEPILCILSWIKTLTILRHLTTPESGCNYYTHVWSVLLILQCLPWWWPIWMIETCRHKTKQ